MAAFHLTLTMLIELFHPCRLSNGKQGQTMLASVVSVKWNVACVANFLSTIFNYN